MVKKSPDQGILPIHPAKFIPWTSTYLNPCRRVVEKIWIYLKNEEFPYGHYLVLTLLYKFCLLHLQILMVSKPFAMPDPNSTARTTDGE
jgi:hypothetical protein